MFFVIKLEVLLLLVWFSGGYTMLMWEGCIQLQDQSMITRDIN